MQLNNTLEDYEIELVLDAIMFYTKHCSNVATRRLMSNDDLRQLKNKYEWAKKADDLLVIKKKINIKSLQIEFKHVS